MFFIVVTGVIFLSGTALAFDEFDLLQLFEHKEIALDALIAIIVTYGTFNVK